jgi:hypothetical protein
MPPWFLLSFLYFCYTPYTTLYSYTLPSLSLSYPYISHPPLPLQHLLSLASLAPYATLPLPLPFAHTHARSAVALLMITSSVKQLSSAHHLLRSIALSREISARQLLLLQQQPQWLPSFLLIGSTASALSILRPLQLASTPSRERVDYGPSPRVTASRGLAAFSPHFGLKRLLDPFASGPLLDQGLFPLSQISSAHHLLRLTSIRYPQFP